MPDNEKELIQARHRLEERIQKDMYLMRLNRNG